MPEADLIQIFIDPLEKQEIEYIITGAVASIVYGEPRLTNDIDLILNFKKEDIDPFIKNFPLNRFYCPPKETILIECNRKTRAHFNLIHHESGLKADCYLMGQDPLHIWGMQNKRRIEMDPQKAIWIAPPEYVILRKLEFFREGGSSKHLEDIQKMLTALGKQIDRKFLAEKICQMGLGPEWDKIKLTSGHFTR